MKKVLVAPLFTICLTSCVLFPHHDEMYPHDYIFLDNYQELTKELKFQDEYSNKDDNDFFVFDLTSLFDNQKSINYFIDVNYTCKKYDITCSGYEDTSHPHHYGFNRIGLVLLSNSHERRMELMYGKECDSDDIKSGVYWEHSYASYTLRVYDSEIELFKIDVIDKSISLEYLFYLTKNIKILYMNAAKA